MSIIYRSDGDGISKFVKIMLTDKNTGECIIKRTDGKPFPCGAMLMMRHRASLTGDEHEIEEQYNIGIPIEDRR